MVIAMKHLSFAILIGFLLFLFLSQVSSVEARSLRRSFSRKTYRSYYSGQYGVKYPAWSLRGR